MSLGLLLTYDNIHFQYESGFISAEGWASTQTDMKFAMKWPFFRRYMLSKLGRMRPTFRELVIQASSAVEEAENEQR